MSHGQVVTYVLMGLAIGVGLILLVVLLLFIGVIVPT